MKLYVWDFALMDEKPGLVCALAFNMEHALQLIKEKDKNASLNLLGPARVITKPEAFIVWGE